jgi:hypothetical protein
MRAHAVYQFRSYHQLKLWTRSVPVNIARPLIWTAARNPRGRKTFVTPYISDVLGTINSFSPKFPTLLISFPEALLRDVIMSSFIFVLSYHILFRGCEPSVSLVLSLSLELWGFVGREVTLRAANIAGLANVMPMSLTVTVCSLRGGPEDYR